jgi:hypothetical protein
VANLAHPGELARPRLLNPNSAAAGVAAGCLMSLGAPLSFAAARGAALLMVLPPISVPSLAIVGGAFRPRLLATVTVGVVAIGVVGGLAAVILHF